MKSEYRDKLKETLGTASGHLCGSDPEDSTLQVSLLHAGASHRLDPATATASGAGAEATRNTTGGDAPAERKAATTNTIIYQQRQQGARAQETEQAEPAVVAGCEASPTTVAASSSQRTSGDLTATAATVVAGQQPAGGPGTATTNRNRGWRGRRGGVGKVVQLTAALAAA